MRVRVGAKSGVGDAFGRTEPGHLVADDRVPVARGGRTYGDSDTGRPPRPQL
jgi:hypothetical protein